MRKSTVFKLALIMVSIAWGAGFPITKIALDTGMEPNSIMAIRFLIASFLLLIFLWLNKMKLDKKEIIIGLFSGFILGIAFSFQTVGLKYTTAARNAFITGAYVVIVPFFIWFVTKKSPKFNVYISSILCFTGIGLLSLNGEKGVMYGDLLTLLSACFFALQIMIIGVNIKKRNPIVINTFQMLSAGVLTLAFNIFFENFSIIHVRINKIQIMAIGFLIIFNTLIAFLVQTMAQKYVSSSTTALILSTEILFGAITSMIFMGEQITLKVIIGGMLIFFSVIIAEK